MPRIPRWVIPGAAYHVVQRGANKQEVFADDDDRRRFLSMLAKAPALADTAILAYCLMGNHVHLVVRPARGDSLALLGRRVFGKYAQWFNLGRERSGPLWQGRFYSCPMDPRHLKAALAYVENNPARAGLCRSAGDWMWSSAQAHLGLVAFPPFLDRAFWLSQGTVVDWLFMLEQSRPAVGTMHHHLRRCTSTGRPFGSEAFLGELESKFGREWQRWPYDKELSDQAVARAAPATAGKRGR